MYRVVGFEIVGPCKIRVAFDDGTEQEIDFGPVLEGPVYGALRDQQLCNKVEIHPEAHTLVWPNGADFDPETLHEWPKYAKAMKRMAKQWAKQGVKAV